MIWALLMSICGAPPAPPLEDNAWAVQISETQWRTEIPGWVVAPFPECWVLGRVELTYPQEVPETTVNDDVGPWVYGIDYPVGTACPVEAIAGCYVPPHPEAPPP